MSIGAYTIGARETLVNSKVAGVQTDSTMAALASGGFIICWTDLSGDGSGSAVRAQLYTADGVASGAEFLVNSTTLNAQDQPSVAALASGGFVVTWTDNSATGPDSDKTGVKAQMYDAAGIAVGGEFLVNTTTKLGQGTSSIASLASGGFVISWVDASASGPDAKGTGIRAQIYSASGARVGGEFLINTTIPNSQQFPALTGLASGGFVATWVDSSGLGGDASATSLKAQVFSSTGTKIGTEFLVNTATNASQDQPVIAALDGGGFVVVWRDLSLQGDTSGAGVKAQVYDAAGARVGGELLVNATSFNAQDQPTVTRIAGGGFAVSWRDNSNLTTDASGFGIKVQIFDAAGTRLGSEFVVNGITTGNQEMPNIIALQSGALVVSWTDYSGQGGDSDGSIKARILVPTVAAIDDIAITDTVISETAVQGTTVASFAANGAFNALYSYQIIDDSTGGAFAIQGSKLIVQDSLALDYETSPLVSITVRATDTFGASFDKTTALSLADSVDEKRYAAATELLANTTIAGGQQQASIVALADGRFVLTWTDGSTQGRDTSGDGIKGQIVNADGSRSGGEFQVNTTTLNGQNSTSVAALPTGGFVVTWVDLSLTGGDASVSSIKGQLFDTNGVALGGEFLVNTATPNAQRTPSVVGLSSGNFVVTWTDTSLLNGDASGSAISAQLFDANGNRLGSETLVNTATTLSQETPVVAALVSGGYVISWRDTSLLGGDASKDSVKAQIFDAGGARVGSEFLVNTQTAGNQQQPAIVGLASGGFAIAWADNGQQGGDPDYYGIRVQRFDANGAKVGAELLANTTTVAGQITPTISALSDGGFVVGWGDYSGSGSELGSAGIKAQIFAEDGNRVGSEFIVDTQSLGAQVDPAIAGGKDGNFALVWTDFSGQGDDAVTGIKFRAFTPLSTQGGPPPLIAVADVVSGTEDQSSVFAAATLLANDVNSTGLPIGIASVTAVLGGDVALDPDGNVVFTPAANFSGTALFTYLATNTAGVTATGRVSVAVAGVNDLPVAVDDQIGVLEDGSPFAVSALLGNDSDVDPGDVLQIQSLPATTVNGASLSLANGIVTFNPGGAYQSLAVGETASDSFGYTIVDSAGATATAVATLTIAGVNDAPTGLALNGTRVDENAANGTVVGTLVASDVDRNDALVYALTNTAGGRFTVDPTSGVITVASGTLLDYETAASQLVIGRATDESGAFVEASFTIGINNLPEPRAYTGDNGANSFTAPTNDLWTINGLGGNDTLTGNASADTIFGEAGNDMLDGAGGADTLYGGIGADTYVIDNVGDRVVEYFGEGIDTVVASVDFGLDANIEKLTQTGIADIAATGNDFANTITGNAGQNRLSGGLGGDLLVGMDGADTLYGEVGNDFIQGNNGDDMLIGGAGLDELIGGAGADRFVFDVLAPSAERDTVKDFTPGEDLFVFARAVFDAFAATPPGALPASAFTTGTAATTIDQHVIYTPSSGSLFYDPDGSGVAPMVQVAFLGTKPTLTAASFTIG
jgi:VCBS repeat-containing protein